MPPPRRDEPSPEEIDALVDSLRRTALAARAQPAVTRAVFGPHGGVLHNASRSRYVEIIIGQPNTDLVVVDAASGLILDDWKEPTDQLLGRLSQAETVDYDAVTGLR